MFCAPLHSNADFMRSSFSTAFSRSSSAALLLHPLYHDTMHFNCPLYSPLQPLNHPRSVRQFQAAEVPRSHLVHILP